MATAVTSSIETKKVMAKPKVRVKKTRKTKALVSTQKYEIIEYSKSLLFVKL